MLGRDLVRLVLAAVLGAIGLLLAVLGVAWLVADYVFGFEHVWESFVLLAAPVLIPAVTIGLGALRSARKTGAPVPTAAMRQAAAMRETLRP